MNVGKIVIGLLAAMALSWVQPAYAAPNTNPTEFGIEGDLIVLGATGTTEDPDVKIKGFTVFGSTQTTYPGPVQSGAGNVVVNGYLAVLSGMYTSGPSTFTSTVNLPGPTSLYVVGGANGQVMTKNTTTGALQWDTVQSLISGDNLGNHTATETLKMADFGIVNVASVTVNDYVTAGTYMMTGTSMTVTTDLGVGGNSQLGDMPGTDYVGINAAGDVTTALKVVGEDGNDKYSAKFYSGGNLAAWIKRK